MGLAPGPEEIPWFWTEQYDHVLQVAGAPALAEETLARGERTRLYLRGESVVGVACLDAPRDFAAARRLIAGGARIDTGRARKVEIDLRKALAA